ncbi:MAG: type II toxin-antitoxin system PemK/MazF family toxin [Patescibacteria group bacterium]
MYIKEFDVWNKVKQRVNAEQRGIVIRKGEVRWASLGVNVGMEIDGKGESFLRPVLIVDCIGKGLALVVPITSSGKMLPGYLPFEWKEKTDSLCIHHMKTISTKRILRREAKIPGNTLARIKEAIKLFYRL